MSENTNKKKYDVLSVHLDEKLLAQLIAGEVKSTQPLGEVITEEGEFLTLFAHMDKESGQVRRSAKGKVRLNARKQTPRVDPTLVITAEAVEAMKGLTPEQIEAYVRASKTGR